MSWLQLEIRTDPQELPQLEALVLSAGAVSVAVVDAHPEQPGEPVGWQILEPAPGETPLWRALILQVLLPLELDFAPLRQRLLETDSTLSERLEIHFIAEQDWVAATAQDAVDEVFAERLRLRPPLVEPESPQAAGTPISLYLQPGLAFGSGRHATTRLCLSWLAANLRAGQRVLDFGCGSGVLGIAAALLGCQAVAVDYDNQACLATQSNADANSVTQSVQVLDLQQWQNYAYADAFEVVVANILAAPLISLAPTFEQALTRSGHIVLSGVLAEQSEMVMEAYPRIDFESPMVEQGWARLVGQRKS